MFTLNNCHQEIQKHSRKCVFSEDFIFKAVNEVIDNWKNEYRNYMK